MLTLDNPARATTVVKMPPAIERLHADARAPLFAHLLALSDADRRLRFGRAIAPSVVAEYVNRIDFTRDTVLGVRDDQSLLVGMAHLACGEDPAEVALSVLSMHRRRGIASALFGIAVARARRYGMRGIRMLFPAGNVPILRIALRFGMKVRFQGSDAEAVLAIRASAAPTPFNAKERKYS